MKSRKVQGYNLTEILIVIAIIGILIMLALPDQTSTISKAKALEAKTQLNHLLSLQKVHFYEKSRYSENLEEIGFDQQKLATEGGQANYLIAIEEANGSYFRATATAVADFDGDGTFNVWEIDSNSELIEKEKD